MSEEWVIGKNAVQESLRSGRAISKIMISEHLQRKASQSIHQLAKEKGVQVQQVPRKKLDQLVEGNHQGVIASVAAYTYSDMDDIFNYAQERGEAPFLLILDEIEDPHNLGSILRTADAAGVHGVIIPKRRSVGLTTTVAKTSTGAIEYIPVVRVTNLSRTIEELKEQHVWVVGTDAKGEEDYRKLQGDMPIALVIGSEGKGISRLVKEKCDWTIQLPMIGQVTSLNASVSASLLMYEVFRKRHPLGE